MSEPPRPRVYSQSAAELGARASIRRGAPAAWLLGDVPAVASAVIRPPQVRTQGGLLPEGLAALEALAEPAVATAPGALADRPYAPRRRATCTRIRPPRDVVKLEDRLQYLLQPPLEALLAAKSLRFPHHPFPYQLDGVAFLYPRQRAVLADEMGLGKTMQTITSIRLLAHSGQLRRALLVCPKPLVSNWRREFALWAPELSVAVINGPGRRRRWAWSNASAVVTMTNYETVVRDGALLSQALAYDLVVVDEAQRIKNRAGATSQAVRSVPRRRSWALTGTPIENSLDDLVGIFEFVSPGTLRIGQTARAIARAAGDSVLRRTKEEVLTDLPPRILRDEFVDLTPEQWASYQRAEQEGVYELEGLGRELTVQHVFELVLRLKQVCNFDPKTKSSSKLERLEAELDECAASGRKAIVFSQWVDTLRILAERLARFGPSEYHGRVPQAKRDAVIQQFRDRADRRVLLMSYGAGSVGLNLQFASYVFLFDRWWNPAVEDQAINRAHRIGAAGRVTVTRFIASGTIEQRIDEVLREKRELFRTVFDDPRVPRSYGITRGELLALFNLHSPQGPIGRAA